MMMKIKFKVLSKIKKLMILSKLKTKNLILSPHILRAIHGCFICIKVIKLLMTLIKFEPMILFSSHTLKMMGIYA